MKTRNTAHLCHVFGRAAKALFAGVALALSCTAMAATRDLATYSSGTSSIGLSDGDVVTGTATVPFQIQVGSTSGTIPTITLRNMSMDGGNLSNPNGRTGPAIRCTGNATIVLEGDNVVSGLSSGLPGIYVRDGYTLTIKGSGKLTATGNGQAAGIGGGLDLSCGNIVIEGSPTINATGGQYCAAIGGGGNGGTSCGTIAIQGGTINAMGGYWASAIGSGYYASCGNISITGGDVTATAGTDGAGIGGGRNNSSCGSITIGPDITKVTAKTTNESAATLGKGYLGAGITSTVDDTLYNCYTSSTKTRVLEPWDGDLAKVTSDMKVVKAVNGKTLTGILTRNCKITIADGANVTLDGATIDGATLNSSDSDSYSYAGITCLGNARITLKRGSVNTVSGFHTGYPGIYVPVGSQVGFNSPGTLNVSGNGEAPGIGGGYGLDCGNISFSGFNGSTYYVGCPTIHARGGSYSPGIGGGYNASCGWIYISCNIITADAGQWGAGIGSGYCGTCGTITIDGGTVTATGGENGAGIGSGCSGNDTTASCGAIAINAGIDTVTATCGNATDGYAVEPIGHGARSTSGAVTVNQNLSDGTSGNTRTIATWNGDLASLTGNVTLRSDTTITGTLSRNCKISIADGVTVTLDNAVITNGENSTSYRWAGLNCEGSATIVLADGSENVVKGFYEDWPGIYVPSNKTLIVQGTGALDASSNGYGAGIGGGYNIECGNIRIYGGTLTATGGNKAAGIGGGAFKSCGAIVIGGSAIDATGGATVTAVGGYGAAGIGGGGSQGDNLSSCGSIAIVGSQTQIDATGGGQGAGIGGGYKCTNGNIVIYNGTVVATGGVNAAGIGSGCEGASGVFSAGSGDSIHVTATCVTDDVDPIGAGKDGTSGSEVLANQLMSELSADGRTRTISLWNGNLAALTENMTVRDGMTLFNALGANVKVSIADGATVTLSNATITCGSNSSDYDWAGLTCEGRATIILKEENHVKGFYENYPGIFVPAGRTLTIAGDGSLTASSSGNGAGIGGGLNLDCGNIRIEGGVISATGGYRAAGIGGGGTSASPGVACGNIEIVGGDVFAQGGGSAAGIGGGNYGTCGNITVGAGIVRVKAQCYGSCPPIGAGYSGSCGTVTVDPSLADDVSSTSVRIITPENWDGNLSTLTRNARALDGRVIYGTLGGQYKISIADGATVTLSNAVINGVSSSNYSWAGLNCQSNATIILAPGSANVVKGFHDDYPGIHVPVGATLTISGSGSLDASSNNDGAGIGGGEQIACGNIVISNGIITATGGFGAAGIGAGRNVACGDITITGGSVTAIGGSYAAGIGTGDYASHCGNISIMGGSVTATGGRNGAGIGSADDSSSCGNIYIGANILRVEATRGSDSAEPIGAGAGNSASCGTVTVDSSLTDTTSADGLTRTIVPAPVWNGDLATLTGDVTVESDMTLHGELAGQYKISIADGVTVTLNNAIITNGENSSSYPWAGLNCQSNATIILAAGSENFVRGFYQYYPGIHVPAGATLTISGTGSLDASGNRLGAGIGGGYDVSCGDIIINGGTIIATGGVGCPGIGGGCNSDKECGNITITGGDVTAKSGNQSAGIGSGSYGSCGNIAITGGTVTAIGGNQGASIGSGFHGQCGAITIGAGITRVVAKHLYDNQYNPVGAGDSASCGSVTIDPTLSTEISDDGKTYTYSSSVWDGNLATLTGDVTIDHDMTLTGELAELVKISIADGVTITLNNAIITNGVDDSVYDWAGLNCQSNATIILAPGSTNVVNGFYEDWPGIYVPVGATLTISGTGSLDVSGNIDDSDERWAPGIGGGYEKSCGNIIIAGGTIHAIGGTYAAAIGGGFNSVCGDITITGGDIIADGGSRAAGIGSGYSEYVGENRCGTITIGADITRIVATSGGEGAAPIGAGADGTCDGVIVDPSLSDDHGDSTRTITSESVWAGNLAALDEDVVIDHDMTLYGELARQCKISIADGVTVTLNNAVITNGENNTSYRWAGINCQSNATIILASGSENFVKGFYDRYPGIHVPAGATLTIGGTGSLDASSNGYGAGIGGEYNLSCGNIVINSGTINAAGGVTSAAIGGAYRADCGTITINGGTVYTNGGNMAAAIGCGRESTCTGITINGGTITATGDSGSGIGSGYEGYCTFISINGGDVAATGGTCSAGIGGGSCGSCGAISITGGKVSATGQDGSAGIGGGTSGGACGAITIGAGITRVVATCGNYSGAKPIGEGTGAAAVSVTVDPSLSDTTSVDGKTRTITVASAWNGNLATLTGDVTIDHNMTLYGRLGGLYKISVADGVTVTLNGAEIPGSGSSYQMAGIACLGDATIILAEGSVNTVKGCYRYPGIHVPTDYTLTIKGTGSLSATGGDGGAGIGGGYMRSYGNIVIESGTITATGKGHAAGIGSSEGASYAGDITILGGTVTAVGGSFSAGIGGGEVCGDITISGGNVTATGAYYAPGIGSGWNEDESFTVLINGGTVTAVGGEKAAGIGGGKGSSGGDIVIDAGVTLVVATHGTGCDNAIGAGDGGSDVSVTVDSGLFDVTDGATRTISHVAPPVQSETIGGTTWYYRAYGAGVEIYRDEPPAVSPAPSGALEIPSSLGGHQVVAVGQSAFASCAGLVSVTIPVGATTIGQQAFYGCSSLASVTIPGSVTSIGSRAFASSGLGTVYVAAGRTNFVKELLLAAGHEQAFVDGITFVEMPWDGNLAGLYYDITIGTDMTIYGELAGQYKISVANGVTLTLNNVVITNGANNSSCSWAGINCQSNATIILAAGSENFVKGFYDEYPGIHVPVGATLTISGTGSLDASSNGSGAGIGGGKRIDCGSIVISNGTVVATGGSASPGIGAGSNGNCGDITITGGNVTAKGGNYAAGIGTGDYTSQCGDITITGGLVTAEGGSKGAGIGSADDSSRCGDIYIGADIVRVEATCGSGAVPIGAGAGSSASCGTVNTEDVPYDDNGTPTRILAATPPPAWDGNLSTLDRNVTVAEDMTIYGTLAGQYKISIADSVTVTLNNAIITNGAAVAQDNSYSWAGINCLGDAEIILAPGSTNVVSGFYDSYPGIYVPVGSTLTISGSGSLDASSSIGEQDNRWAPGIGGGYEIDCGNIIIAGGTIHAIGGAVAAAIGSGRQASCGDITITGGDITADGGSSSAGIGGGYRSACGTITIGAGITRIVATCGTNGIVPIGAGKDGTCVDVIVASSLLDDDGNPTRTITGGGSSSGYAAWATANGVSGAWNATDANGIANVFRYAFNKPTGNFDIISIEVVGMGYLVIKTPPLVNTDGFSFSIIGSDNVDGTGNVVDYVLNPSGETWFTMAGKPTRFFRLKAEEVQ